MKSATREHAAQLLSACACSGVTVREAHRLLGHGLLAALLALDAVWAITEPLGLVPFRPIPRMVYAEAEAMLRAGGER